MTLKPNHTVVEMELQKAPTGIHGFDEITNGGLAKNRLTIICGNTGSGKTIFSMEFLVNGASKYGEPGVFMSFEERNEDLERNMKSFPYDLTNLIKRKKIYVEYLEIDKAQMIEVGNYDLEGFFVRLQNAISYVGAKRVVIDSLDALFLGLDAKNLRQEIKRLFKWLREKKITALITSVADNTFIAKDGFDQYVADSVIELNNRISNQIAIRRLRIKKMRGSAHGNNEYPFIIDKNGLSVLPLISSLKDQIISDKRIKSGISDLDLMLDGKGFFQGSSILVSGSAGTGKTSIAASLINAMGKRKIRSLYCAFEESTSQILRNMRSIGLDVGSNIKTGLLRFYCYRPTLHSLELHLISIRKIIEEFKPEVIVLDPVTNLMSEGINSEIRQLLAHFVDFLKGRSITTLFTAAITLETIKSNPSDEGISAMMDTWILLRDIEQNSERNRGIYILKSRGMNHSTQVREFVITNKGIVILPIYISPGGILTGTAKLEYTLKQEEQDMLLQQKLTSNNDEVEAKRKIMEKNISFIKEEFQSEMDALNFNKIESDIIKANVVKSKKEITDLRSRTNSSFEKSKKRNK